MIPFFSTKLNVEMPRIDKSGSTHWWTDDILKERTRHKVGRLKREIKKHTQNCWKRQHALIKLQELFAYESNKDVYEKMSTKIING
ncbi:hypothetical protein [Nitrososphaeria virus YSH_462411]|uniref:Uncharacterized protein n=1 Tax=Nitrososphaeria virus YSH_462411 TaxID=3071321 RepID=A0A976YDV6_9CAUD|nr:hypothetical protein QKV92_gp61 [Yangshan Harbor Nitrososphaeria virus]UVF62333.1 hypothetical protein [Nitrososphaeria virus YSH_462411]